MRIQHNIAALNSYRNLGTNNTGVSKNLEKLSSGFRINRAGDDAAGLAISEKMRSQITGINTATKNANDGISLVQTAEGALTEVHSMLNRMVEIATQSANGVYEDGVDRQALQDEMNALTDEIDRISEGTNFNKRNLLDGTYTDKQVANVHTKTSTDQAGVDLVIEVDAKDATGAKNEINFVIAKNGTGNNTATFTSANTVTIYVDQAKDITAETIEGYLHNTTTGTGGTDEELAMLKNAKVRGTGITTITGANNVNGAGAVARTASDKEMSLQIGDTNKDFNKLNVAIDKMDAETLGIKHISVATEKEAGKAVDVINTAINKVSTQRGELGAIQNRLEHTINNLSVNAENMTAAESRIRDVDMADEMMKYTKNNILVQASQAMLAQANQVPQGVLQLLQ